MGLPEGWAGCLPSSLPAPSALPGSLSALPFSFSDFGFSLSLPFWPDAAEGSSPEGFSAELFEPGFAPAPDEPGLPGFGAEVEGEVSFGPLPEVGSVFGPELEDEVPSGPGFPVPSGFGADAAGLPEG